MKQKEKRLTPLDLSFELKVSPQTINNWYKWYYSDEPLPKNTPKLPMYKKTKSGRRYWLPSDIPKLKVFANWIPKGRAGVMGNTNYKAWGERGERAQRNKKKVKEKQK